MPPLASLQRLSAHLHEYLFARHTGVPAVGMLALVLAACAASLPEAVRTTPTIQEPTEPKYFPSDEPLHMGREQFGRGNYGIAERYFRDAVEKAPKRDVLERVMSGMSNKEIARDLKLGQGTVKIHLAGLYRTLGVKSRVAAAAAGLRMFHEREQNA